MIIHPGILAVLGSGLVGVQVAADSTFSINPASSRGAWEGWGVSLAWWAKVFGTRSDLADIFFTRNSVSFNGAALPGLGLNIARYNAGACSANSVNGTTMASNSILPYRKIDGYWIDWASADPRSSSWSWGVDASQRSMMALAKARGADRFELFSNSPMWWMCSNHNPAGAANGGENIQSWNIVNHALYLATIAKYARDNWGITFASVEAFNEPSSSWWTATNNQEGSHFSVATMATVISALRSQLNGFGLTSTLVAASDETSYDLAVSTWNSFNSTTRSSIGRINVHGYQQGSGRRDLLYSAASAAGIKIWNSEYGDSDATGTQLAQNLLLDFYWMHPTAWTYWQAIDVSGWGLIVGDLGAGTLSAAAKKFFVLAHFTRHIRAGMTILDTSDPTVASAYDAPSRKLVIVAANFNAGQYINFDLSRFSAPSANGALVPRWSTHFASAEQYAAYSDTYISGTKFWSYFDQNTVQTFEVSNVSL